MKTQRARALQITVANATATMRQCTLYGPKLKIPYWEAVAKRDAAEAELRTIPFADKY